jgi:hypothetical protein
VRTGKVAQSVISRSLRCNRSRDNHEWAIRRRINEDSGNVFDQPIASYQDEPVYPVIEEINEYEAVNIGQNVRAGDLRLIISGLMDMDETTMLICDGEKCDIFRAPQVFYRGDVLMRVIYLHRPKEHIGV